MSGALKPVIEQLDALIGAIPRGIGYVLVVVDTADGEAYGRDNLDADSVRNVLKNMLAARDEAEEARN